MKKYKSAKEKKQLQEWKELTEKWNQVPKFSRGSFSIPAKEIKVVSKEKENPRSLNSWVIGPVTSKQIQKYTGDKIIGISCMHKSNLVPVFSQEEAQDISKMRRN